MGSKCFYPEKTVSLFTIPGVSQDFFLEQNPMKNADTSNTNLKRNVFLSTMPIDTNASKLLPQR